MDKIMSLLQYFGDQLTFEPISVQNIGFTSQIYI